MNVSDDMVMGPIVPPASPACATGNTTEERSERNQHKEASSTDSSEEPATIGMHRLAIIRRQQGISVRSAARRMGVPMEQVRREERPESNLTLEDLKRWQRALEVPLINLLIDQDSPLSAPVLTRAQWLRLMKTIKALIELDASPAATRMSEMLERQVLEIMPELKDVGAWHSVGQRRTQDEMGRIAEDTVPVSFARDGLQ